jgi:2-aminoadipate transaminase
MLDAMHEHFPREVSWTRPQGGLFLWVTLPVWINATDVLTTAIEHKVAFVPGSAFHSCGGGHNTLRLNFSNATPDKIKEGISRLGAVLADAIEWRPVEALEPAHFAQHTL